MKGSVGRSTRRRQISCASPDSARVVDVLGAVVGMAQDSRPSLASQHRLSEPMSTVLASLPLAPTPGAVVDALVPACADLAWIAVPIDGHLRICAYSHIDPLRLSALADFQRFYAPPLDDALSFM